MAAALPPGVLLLQWLLLRLLVLLRSLRLQLLFLLPRLRPLLPLRVIRLFPCAHVLASREMPADATQSPQRHRCIASHVFPESQHQLLALCVPSSPQQVWNWLMRHLLLLQLLLRLPLV